MLHDFVGLGTNFCRKLCFKIEYTGIYLITQSDIFAEKMTIKIIKSAKQLFFNFNTVSTLQFITLENKIYMVKHIISIIDDYFTAYMDKMEVLQPDSPLFI